MQYKKNIHLSHTQQLIINGLIQDSTFQYINSLKPDKDIDATEEIWNASYINIYFDLFKKICNNLSKRDSFYYHNSDYYKLWQDRVSECSRDKILLLNSKHTVKKEFRDLAHFNRWEKLRTFCRTNDFDSNNKTFSYDK